MKAIEFLETMKKYAEKYAAQGTKSVLRNRHMNELTSDNPITSEQTQAVVVDFINYIGGQCGIDYGLYTSDIKPKEDTK